MLFVLLGISSYTYVLVIFLFIISTVISTGIIAVLNRIPYINQIIGAK